MWLIKRKKRKKRKKKQEEKRKNLCTVVDITVVLAAARANSCAFKAVVGRISRIVTREMQLFLIFAQAGILKPRELIYFGARTSELFNIRALRADLVPGSY